MNPHVLNSLYCLLGIIACLVIIIRGYITDNAATHSPSSGRHRAGAHHRSPGSFSSRRADGPALTSLSRPSRDNWLQEVLDADH